MRTTCLYCELLGRETPLVPLGHWGFCPIHSKAYLEARGLGYIAALTLKGKL